MRQVSEVRSIYMLIRKSALNAKHVHTTYWYQWKRALHISTPSRRQFSSYIMLAIDQEWTRHMHESIESKWHSGFYPRELPTSNISQPHSCIGPQTNLLSILYPMKYGYFKKTCCIHNRYILSIGTLHGYICLRTRYTKSIQCTPKSYPSRNIKFFLYRDEVS